MKKTLRFLALTLASVFALSACALAAPQQDRSGNPIQIPAEVNRIVSLAPATTQILESLGMLDKLVGIELTTPAYVKGIDGLPQFDMMAPDIERIASLEPDIVFTSGMSYLDGNPFAMLTQMGICVVDIPSSNSIEAVKEDVIFTAACLGLEEAGIDLAKDMQQRIDAIAAIGATIENKKTVLFEIAALPYIYSFGSDTFLNEMIQLIGAENVLAGQVSWLSVNEENAVNANPDVILTNVNYIENPVDEILARTGWDAVTAVANGDVHYIDNAASSLPNHHIVVAMEQMALAVYPEAYASFAE